MNINEYCECAMVATKNLEKMVKAFVELSHENETNKNHARDLERTLNRLNNEKTRTSDNNNEIARNQRNNPSESTDEIKKMVDEILNSMFR